jgi:hypothetical protein
LDSSATLILTGRREQQAGRVFVFPDSTVVTKAEFIQDLDSRDLVWESVSARDEKARIYGDTAVVTGKFFGRGK